MKAVIFTWFFVGVLAFTSAQMECVHRKPEVPDDWLDMVDPCVKQMRNQIQEELRAAMQYLAMGAHFSKDDINKPGFAKMFFEAATEEREHAIKLISYLLMRGELTSEVSKLINKHIEPTILKWESGLSALKDALKLEAQVTTKIRKVIATCEDNPTFNDYHLVDYLTGVFLEEQYKGQREIAGRISTLDKMIAQHGALGEWLFDKKLLGVEF